MSYTLKALARRVASDDSEEAIKSAARRIEHWGAAGLMGLASIEFGPKAIGRGRVRRYPEEVVPWCLLWAALADRGFGIVTMAGTTQAIEFARIKAGQESRWLRQAMRGEGPTLFLFDESAGIREPGTRYGLGHFKFKLARSPIKLSDSWSGGVFLNLTAVYASK